VLFSKNGTMGKIISIFLLAKEKDFFYDASQDKRILMRKLFYLMACCCSLSLLRADADQTMEEKNISLLINATKTSLESLKELQTYLAAFREQEARCIEKANDTEALFSLSESALALVTRIHENKVEPYFRPAFLEELERLKKTAQSKNIPPILSHDTTSSSH
jgi:hypothetical protein